jgi:hypothetical protein
MHVIEVAVHTVALLIVGILIGRIAFGRRRTTGKHAVRRSTIPVIAGVRPACGLDEEFVPELKKMTNEIRRDPRYSGYDPMITNAAHPLIAGDEPILLAEHL